MFEERISGSNQHVSPVSGVVGCQWEIARETPSAADLAKSLKLSPVIGQLLEQRGMATPDDAAEFLEPRLRNIGDPFALTDLRAAAERLLAAVDGGERIAIYGDYDVDGITSSALLWRVLRKLGANVETFLPLRIEEGYGLSDDGVRRCVEKHEPRVLLAVDCGTTSIKQVAWLRAQGIDVVIADHHELLPELPDANALVNPHRDGKYEYLASVGLAFKLCHGLLKTRPNLRGKIDLRDYLDLVATGTVADIVPLVEENRIYVRTGLKQIAQTHWTGLRQLCVVAGIDGVPTTTDIGFRIGPRINASGRLGDAARSLALLKTGNLAEADRLAHELNKSNQERQVLEKRTHEQAEELLDAYSPESGYGLVVSRKDWHPGVIGIVASRIQRSYHRPAVVIAVGEDAVGKGSCRSIDGFSIIEALRACSDHLLQFGGHEMAAGLSIREDRIEAFRSAFNNFAQTVLQPQMLRPTLQLSGRINARQISEAFFYELDQLAPFGRHNPEPIFMIEGVRVIGRPREFSRGHLKFKIEGANKPLEVIAWRMAEQNPWPQTNDLLAGVIERDDYYGGVRVQLKDWQVSAAD